MRLTRETVKVAMAAALVVSLVFVVVIGIGLIKLWPVARTWTQSVLGGSNIESARKVLGQAGALVGNDRMQQLSRAGEGVVELAALAGKPEIAEILKWTAAVPALGPMLQNGSYQKALEEAVRQNVPNITQIKLDQVASAEVRALLAEVQQVLAKRPQAAEAASTVNVNVLNLLKSEAFARLRASPGFALLLSGAEPATKAE